MGGGWQAYLKGVLKMIELFVGSTTKYAGKTMVALGILDYWQSQGLKVAYFKPVGKNFNVKEDVKIEEDVSTIKERFSLEDELTLMCPYHLGHQDYISLVLGKLGDAESKIYDPYRRRPGLVRRCLDWRFQRQFCGKTRDSRPAG
jgi:hypothetical protein